LGLNDMKIMDLVWLWRSPTTDTVGYPRLARAGRLLSYDALGNQWKSTAESARKQECLACSAWHHELRWI